MEITRERLIELIDEETEDCFPIEAEYHGDYDNSDYNRIIDLFESDIEEGFGEEEVKNLINMALEAFFDLD